MKKVYEAPAIDMLIIEPVVMNETSGPKMMVGDPDGIDSNDDVLPREYDWDE